MCLRNCYELWFNDYLWSIGLLLWSTLPLCSTQWMFLITLDPLACFLITLGPLACFLITLDPLACFLITHYPLACFLITLGPLACFLITIDPLACFLITLGPLACFVSTQYRALFKLLMFCVGVPYMYYSLLFPCGCICMWDCCHASSTKQRITLCIETNGLLKIQYLTTPWQLGPILSA